jgi:dTDP-4-dehydrorhamnose 3,5-epimerase
MSQLTRFVVSDLPLAGLKLIQRRHFVDGRGLFSRLFCMHELRKAGWHKPIAQINLSFTAQQGVVRGLHFQKAPHTEMKLVTCIQGMVWDVAVDLRAESQTFLHWHAEILSAENNRSLLIPDGFAHGFQTLSDNVTLIYSHSAEHKPDYESALNVRDPKLAIAWPIPITMLSSKDSQYPYLNSSFKGVFL